MSAVQPKQCVFLKESYLFSVRALQQQELAKDFAQKIIFSGEAHLHLDGYVTKQNCCI